MHACYIKKRSERRTPEKKKENGGNKNKRRRGGRRKLFYCHHAHLTGKVSRAARISRTRSIQVLLWRKVCHSMRNILLSSILLQFLLLFIFFSLSLIQSDSAAVWALYFRRCPSFVSMLDARPQKFSPSCRRLSEKLSRTWNKQQKISSWNSCNLLRNSIRQRRKMF